MHYLLLLALLIVGTLTIPAAAETPSCVIGSPRRNELINDFNRRTLNPETDSFLRSYRNYKTRMSLRAGFHTQPIELPLKRRSQSTEADVCVNCANNPATPPAPLRTIQTALNNQNRIPQECVEIAIRRAPSIAGTSRRYCENNRSSPQNLSSHPCITTDILDYVTYSINKAIECLSSENDPIDAHAIFGKINNESGFGFYTSSTNGIGLMQLTTDGARESGGKMASGQADSYGKRFIDNIVATNPKCKDFQKLRELPLQQNSDGHARICQFVSLGDGIARSALNGIGLYLYYRNQYSLGAEHVLHRLGITQANPDYRKIRSFVTLAMYSRHGPNDNTRAAFYSIDYKIRDPAKITHEEFYTHAIATGRLNYLREVENRYRDMQKYIGDNSCPFTSLLGESS